MPATASSPRMVGRGDELRVLRTAVAEGRAGTPRTVIVRGEAGIGKTRLVQELLTELPAGDPPIVVGIGQCVDLGPIGTAFGPIRRILRDLHAAVGDDAFAEAAGSPAVLATLAALVPGIGDAPERDDAVGAFAEATESVLEALSARHHLVLILEDLQWADAATLALLKTFATALRARHLTVVATYRSDDVDRFHPLRPVLAELDRTRGVQRIELAPLSTEEVAEQIALLAAPGDEDQDLAALVERSGGIPFLVEELVDLEAGALPETLRDLVLARYERLSDTARDVVRIMAAGGVHADHDVLAAVTPHDDDALDAALREAIETRVVVADGAGYRFRHALTREAVHSEMLPSERVRVHRRYAETLDEDAPDAVSAIAEHWLAARDLPAAFDATVVALRHGRRGFSPATTAKLVERLTELWHQVPDAEQRAGMTFAELHLRAASAWHDLGEFPRALRATNEGLEECTDPLTRAALLRQRSVELYNTEQRDSRADLDAAIALLETIDDSRARVLLSRSYSNIALSGPRDEAEDFAHRAIALAEEAGDDSALAVALTTESWRLSNDEDDEPAALAPIERAMTLRLLPSMRTYAGAAQVDLLARLGRFDEAAELGAQLRTEAVEAGIERGSGSAIALSVARAHFAAGRPADGIRSVLSARRTNDHDVRTARVRMLARHHAWNDDPDARDALLARELPALDAAARGRPRRHRAWLVEQAEAALTLRELGASTIDDALLDDVIAAAEDRDSALLRRSAAVIGGLVLASRPVDAVDAAHVDRLRAAVDEWSDRGVAPVYADVLRAVLADAVGDASSPRVARWRAAVQDERVLPVWHRHVVRLRLAAALIEDGARDEATELLEGVAAEASGQGVARAARWARELSERAGLGADRRVSSGGTGLSALTARERQVLALVAEGLTNPQIGARLFISPKTASVHVSAILAKINAANRAEAAALYAAMPD